MKLYNLHNRKVKTVSIKPFRLEKEIKNIVEDNLAELTVGADLPNPIGLSGCLFAS